MLIKRITNYRVEKCLEAIESICAAERLDEYLIGFTSRNCAQKADFYRGLGFEDLVALADQMTDDAALDLESQVQKEIIINQWSDLVFRKYHSEKKDKVLKSSNPEAALYRSSGGRKHPGKPCLVYIAWWDQ
jgi:hypothetical protein